MCDRLIAHDYLSVLVPDCKCKACSVCQKCTPADEDDVDYEDCQSWCSGFGHCNQCKCKNCPLCRSQCKPYNADDDNFQSCQSWCHLPTDIRHQPTASRAATR